MVQGPVELYLDRLFCKLCFSLSPSATCGTGLKLADTQGSLALVSPLLDDRLCHGIVLPITS